VNDRFPRGRFAPSPTGLVHLGNASAALVAWLSVRSRRGTLVWRLEDLDGPRVVAGMADAAARDLAWLGLDWDEGPDRPGDYGPYLQSERSALYQAALARLVAARRIFPCRLSRKELREMASAPHGPTASADVYPASLRPTDLPDDWYEQHVASAGNAALRFRVDDAETHYVDRVYGSRSERVAESVGDFVLARRDGLFAYQLAVVVDDIAMRIDDVVRGADLLDSTARQIQLIEALGGERPAYAHVPLVRNAAGEKLSKRDATLTLVALRDAGVSAEQIVGYLAASLGLLDEPRRMTAAALLERFDWSRLRCEDRRVPGDAVRILRAIR
jgi:glutamyl-tRNA synthetase